MVQEFNAIKFDNCAEIVEKKSRFIANLIYVSSEEDAINKIKDIKKKYHDARHNCFAYRVLSKDGVIQRSSDDGEPSGTAGAPMLTILEKNNIVNVLLVVTRYFGGILLGTGGLVKAYTESSLKALNENELEEKELGYEVLFNVPYSEIKRIEYFLKTNNILITRKDYVEDVMILTELSQEKYKNIEAEFPKNVNENIEYEIKQEKIISKNTRK